MSQGRYLGVITARGGSKSLPRKNLLPLLGKPLLAYTCESAMESRRLDRVIISTDDQEIADVARRWGVEVPFMRPPELAQDDTPHLPVLQHAVRWMVEREGYRPDAVMVLQPTSPLRRAEHIDGAIEVMERTGADTVVSVVEVPHRFNPVSLMKMTPDGRLEPYLEGPMVLRRQDKPVVYARNGPVVLLVSYRTLMEEGSLYGRHVRPYLMSELDSFDVDTQEDLFLIESVLLNRERAHETRR